MDLKSPYFAWKVLASPFLWLWNSFDLRDIFLLSGIGMIGYGIYLRWDLGLALLIDGVLLAGIGYLMRGK